MTMERVEFPFAEAGVDEVPLTASPLGSVLFQVRFPGPVSRIQADLASREIQDALAEWFPYADQQDSFELVMAPGQAASARPGNKVWVLTSDSGSRTINIGADAISLTINDYVSRSDLIVEISRVLSTIQKIVNPPHIARIGVRYLNRVEDENGDLGRWIKGLAEGARGILAAQENHDENIVFSLSQVAYKYPNSQHALQARWGLVPADAVIDASMQPVSRTSWILDTDAFIEDRRPFDGDAIAKSVEELAGRSYRFFRWVVTPACLVRFGPQGESHDSN